MGARRGRGRPILDELTRAERLVVRTQNAATAVEEELIQALCLSEDSARNEVVKQVATARLSLFEKLEMLNLAKFENRKAGLEFNAIQEKRTRLMAEINSFPRLGFTTDEWNAINQTECREAPGRPSLQLELRVVRARKAFSEAVKALRELEAVHGRKPCRLDSLRDPAADETKPGRRKSDFIGKLDWEERYLSRKLDELLRLKALGGKTPVFRDGVFWGRTPMPIHDRISATQNKLADIRALIAEQVSKLSPMEAIDRELRLCRVAASAVRKKLHSPNDTSNHQVLRERLSHLENAIAELISFRAEIAESHKMNVPHRDVEVRTEGGFTTRSPSD